ncbi:MAG: vanomycin resistance protein VanB [Actinophytocola sp.]|nr:vanomycin resistance protein VanB [Actinophytocola sp.]
MADDQHYWPAWDSDKGDLSGRDTAPSDAPVEPPTVAFRPVGAPGQAMTQAYPSNAEDPTVHEFRPVGGDEQFAQFTGGMLADEPAGGDEPPGRKLRSGLGRAMMVAGGVLAVAVLVYAVDLVMNWGDVPRGVTVAGVDVGGMNRTAAEDKLRNQLQPRFDDPVKIIAGDVETTLDPVAAGLAVDWQATLEQAGNQPLSPVDRITSIWTERDVGIVGKSDEEKLNAAVASLAKKELNHRKTEGTIKFEPAGGDGAVTPVAVKPRAGQELTSAGDAADKIDNNWLHQNGVELEVKKQPVKATEDGVKATLEELVKPAVSGPIVMRGEGANATLRPETIGEAFEFSPKNDGSLKAQVDQEKLKAALAPPLKSTEREGRDAEIVFEGDRPTVKESKVGREIDWKKSLEPYLDVIKETDDRVLEASYKKKKPKVTTEQAEDLGIKEVIGEFRTTGFANDSGVNIRVVAEEVNGAIVKPGDTFSLNGFTGPRTKAEGYVDAGIIQDGIPGRAVGGGISQFATTLYNASYFAGLKDAGHKEHSYYISRYPMAREATVYQYANGASGIDIAFTNNAKTGVAIQTNWTSESVEVKIWGTKRYRVESKTGDKTNVKEAGKRTVDSKKCEDSPGIDGFTTTDTRILYDIKTNAEVSRETRKVTYNPKPEIVCKKKDD